MRRHRQGRSLLVLVTNRNDLTADWLVAELRRRGTGFVRFNTEDYPTRTKLTWTPSGSRLEFGHRCVDSRSVDVVWWRRPLLRPVMASERPPEEAAWACREASAAIGGFWDQVEAHWVNHPHANERANRKPEQLSRARRRGFDVPPTLITNCTDELRAFAAAHDEVVCKAIKNGQVPAPTANDPDLMLYTTSVAQSSLTNLEDFGPEPYLFQARIPKCHDLRVTVIGDQAFGCRILSQAAPDGTVDWRRADTPELRHEPAE